jgi:L-ascorbate metabolism protein UlaG (beta-lactamase superfamily)
MSPAVGMRPARRRFTGGGVSRIPRAAAALLLFLLLPALAAGAPAQPPNGQPMDLNGHFLNLDGSLPQGFGTFLRWQVLDRLAGRRRSAPDRAPMARMEADRARLARPPAPGEPARLTWLGHASWLVQLDGVSLLIDPALQPSIFGGIARNVEPGLTVEQLPRIDAQLVSHSHYDHLDMPTLQAVGAPVIAGRRLERLFRRGGLFCTELGWWESARVGDVRITFVPSQHWSRRGLFDTNETLWGGFVIEGRSATVYHSGDTAFFEGFAEIGRRFPGLDAALLPIGAYDPAWFMERQHMNPEQALAAFQAVGARTFLAMHWGTFKLTDEPLDEPPQRLEAERQRLGLSPERVRTLAVGETIEVGRLVGLVPASAGLGLAPAGPPSVPAP